MITFDDSSWEKINAVNDEIWTGLRTEGLRLQHTPDVPWLFNWDTFEHDRKKSPKELQIERDIDAEYDSDCLLRYRKSLEFYLKRIELYPETMRLLVDYLSQYRL